MRWVISPLSFGGRLNSQTGVRPLFGRSGEGEMTVGSATEAANQVK